MTEQDKQEIMRCLDGIEEEANEIRGVSGTYVGDIIKNLEEHTAKIREVVDNLFKAHDSSKLDEEFRRILIKDLGKR